MNLLKTEKETLTKEDILKYISDYERDTVPRLDMLWQYYIARNPAIVNRKKTDPNNPDNRIVISYGRKLVTTYTGYAHRPRYTTYKANIEKDQSLENAGASKTKEELYVDELQKTFNINREHIKTSRAGRNMAIFGMAYEIVYNDGLLDKTTLNIKAEPKFFTVDPREMILLYDYDSEPKKRAAIRYYKINPNLYKVEVYYKNTVEIYERKRTEQSNDWELFQTDNYPNFFGEIPVAAYYFGDEMLGLIQPVKDIIDGIDALYSDSMNEFDKFAFAYMIMKRYSITNAIDMKTPGKISETLQNLKKKRIFENVPTDGEIKFLLKDIPTEFIDFMSKNLKEQLHIQSHVPDFINMATGALSGAAITRLMFDFENMVSSAEADFDIGLLERIELITVMYEKLNRPVGDEDMITISHKRNIPLNLLELAQTAVQMKNAGYSAYLIADIMPDDIIPDIQVELERQQKEAEALMMNNIDNGLADLDDANNEDENL